VYEEGDVTVLWHQAVHTYREVASNRPKIVNKNKKGKTCTLIQEFIYRDTASVEPEIYDYASNNWSHLNSNEKLKEKFGIYTRKTFDRFTTKDSYTWNITHNTESTAV
jgi:hypothetical protein